MNSNNLFLAIETSCDDTSLCVMKDNLIIYEKTLSSLTLQQAFGGVVPELASREHLKNIHLIFNDLLKQKIDIYQIKYIFCTTTPGLPGSLHIGIFFAKCLAKILNAKFIKINHLYGHIFSCFIHQKTKIIFPFLSLVVSGGNTIIYLVKSYHEIEILNQTVDDAVGEVYDKVGRALDYKYPCGPIIDQLYDENKANIEFIHHINNDHPYSFSGLKTAILNYINQAKLKNQPLNKIMIISSFQKQIITILVDKLFLYAKKYHLNKINLGGGVSANQLLRKQILNFDKQALFPLLKYTGDNATMICYYGYLLFKNKLI